MTFGGNGSGGGFGSGQGGFGNGQGGFGSGQGGFGSGQGGFGGDQGGFGGGQGGFGGGQGGFGGSTAAGFGDGGSGYGNSGFGDSGSGYGNSGFQDDASAPASASQFTIGSAPIAQLIPSLVLGLVSLVLSGYTYFSSLREIDTTWGVLSGIAWVLAGVLGVSALGLYFTKNTQVKAEGPYQEIGWKQGLFYATLAVLIIAVVLSAILFALWVGRL